MVEYKHDETNLPDDIHKRYFFDNIWIPIHGESHVEIINVDDTSDELALKIEDIKNSIISQLEKYEENSKKLWKEKISKLCSRALKK